MSHRRIVALLFVLALVLPWRSRGAPPKPPSAEELARMEAAMPEKPPVPPAKPRRLLIVSQCEGFTHSSVPYGEKAFEILGRKTGAFTAVAVPDLTILEKPEFDEFDAILMNNTTARMPLLNIDTAGMTDAQRQAAEAREAKAEQRFLDFVRNGKGLIGVHSATDCFYKWPEYGEMMGGYFSGHPWHEPVTVKLDDPGHPLVQAFNGQSFVVTDEIYQFREPYSRDRLRILLSLDATRVNMKKKGIKRTDEDFAVAWIHAVGKGRAFYLSLGHEHAIFWNPAVMRCYLAGIQYALGDLNADATPSAKLSEAYVEQSKAKGFMAGLDGIFDALAGYRLGGDSEAAERVAALVAEHQKAGSPGREEVSRRLAAVAASTEATADARQYACRQLSLIGTDNAVPVLAALADEAEYGDWARYALARMPGAAAENALLAALPRVSGRARVGLIGSLGLRRIKAAVPSLSKLLNDRDALTARAAAEALGRIGSPAAAAALTSARKTAAETARPVIDRAVLACAETARKANDRNRALALYDALLQTADLTAHVRAAAFYGTALLKGAGGIGDVVAALKGNDTEMPRTAARLICDLDAPAIVPAVGTILAQLSPVNQALAIDALADRGDRRAMEPVLALVQSPDTRVQLAAVRALEVLGDGKAAVVLMRTAADPNIDGAVRKMAGQTVMRMSGAGVDAALGEAFTRADAAAKTEYVKVLGNRKAHDALPALLAAARSKDADLVKESCRAIGMLAEPGDLPALVRLQSNLGGSHELENIIVSAARRADNERAGTAAILAGLGTQMPTAARASLLTALGKIGSPSGLAALTDALHADDADIRRAAIKALGEYWPDAAPLDALRNVSREAKEEAHRVLALRGYARMLAMPSKRPIKDTLALYHDALDLAKGQQEKRTLIAGLGALAHPDALSFLQPFLQDKQLQAEALMAAVRISQALDGEAMTFKASLGQGTERNAIDGSPETRWTTGKAMAGGEWFQVDLGYEADIREVMLDAGPVGTDQPRGYEIYVSLNGEDWGKPVAKGGDPKKRKFTVTFPPVHGRAVKIVQTGQATGNFWSINEIRINGRPQNIGKAPLDRSKWKVSASRAPGDAPPQNAIDGDRSKRWGTGGGMQGDDWFQVDMGETHTVYRIVMDAAQSGSDYPRDFRIYTSMDGKRWYGPISAGKGSSAVTTAVCLPTKARFVKIAQLGSSDRNWWSIYDLQILGE